MGGVTFLVDTNLRSLWAYTGMGELQTLTQGV